MKRSEFIVSPDLTAELNRMLTNPVFAQALEIVMSEAKPERPDHTKGDLLHQAALTGARVEGYYQFRDNLLSLTNFRPPASSSTEVKVSPADQMAIDALVRQGMTEEQAMAQYKEFLKESQNNPNL